MNNRNNIIIEELKDIAPRLAKLQRINPFTVPVHYFENLPGAVIKKIQAEDDISILNSIKKENHFDVPYNYFESLPGKILNHVREENSKPGWVDSILSKLGFLLKPKYALTGVAIIIGITFFVIRTNRQQNAIPAFAAAEKQVSSQDVSDYINNNIDQFDEKNIVACISNTELDNAPFPMKSIDSLNINKMDLSQFDDNTIQEIAM